MKKPAMRAGGLRWRTRYCLRMPENDRKQQEDAVGVDERRCPRCGISADNRDFDIVRYAQLMDTTLRQLKFIADYDVYTTPAQTLTVIRAVVASLHLPRDPSRQICAGLDFEHHEHTEMLDNGGWHCQACGESALFGTARTLGTLMTMVPLLHRLQEQLLADQAVWLLPSIATPGPLGSFYGRPVYRVHGVERPLIALSSRAVDVAAGKDLAARIDFG
jgi:hypothetical protein